MRLLSIIFLSFVLICCSDKESENVFSLDDYKYPIESLKTPKVFVYHRMDNPLIKSFNCQQSYWKGEKRYLRRSSLGEGQRDSSIFIIKNGSALLQERYAIVRNNNYRQERIAKHKISMISNKDNKYELISEAVSPFNADIITKFKYVAICDSLITRKVMGKNLICIRESYCSEYSRSNKLVPSYSLSNEITGETIYAKHLGMVSYSTLSKSTGETCTWELESIIDYDDWINNLSIK